MSVQISPMQRSNSCCIGVVVIGRNEGERLGRCLRSVSSPSIPVVYVDSGSTDSSISLAKNLGAEVVQLDTDVPFTAGRARNVGFAKLLEIHPETQFVQFLDGDCELDAGWLPAATAFLESHSEYAIVCGRRKERFPEQTVYNALCDMEWDTDVGEAASCGGDFLARADTFSAIGGFESSLIAGEEPEMCYRIRSLGWRIYRIDKPMALHDAAMTSFSQWARRSSRAGYAYAARAFLHRKDMSGYCFRENIRVIFWALGLPALIAYTVLTVSAWCALLLLTYPVQYLRVYTRQRKRYSANQASSYAFFSIIEKWTEFYGLVLFVTRTIFAEQQRIIEYK